MLTKDAFLGLLGKLPPEAPPGHKILSETEKSEYVRQLISYAVEPGERIEAFLFIPKRAKASLPAVFCHHQHAGDYLLGKSEPAGLHGDPDQAYAEELAGRGFVTLAPDAICFEDRCRDRSEPAEDHLRELHHRLARGETLLGKTLHDVSAGISQLAALPEVDPERIGFLGHSYGGRMALFAPVFDRRIRASVCSGGSTNYRDMEAIQYDFVVPGILDYGDIEDVVRLVEPANLLIMGGDADKWSIGIDAMVAHAKSVFEKGELVHRIYSGGHRFTAEMRKFAYAFLDRHLR